VNRAPVYLDSSAILKLIFEESETAGLEAFLAQWPVQVSSALARVEVMRIAARVEDRAVERETNRVLRAMNLVRVDDGIIAAAAAIKPSGLRSLDALHLATAQTFGHHLAGMVVYDRRLAAAAHDHGLVVWSPD
jgi:predicted nucleic acid-binding protein